MKTKIHQKIIASPSINVFIPRLSLRSRFSSSELAATLAQWLMDLQTNWVSKEHTEKGNERIGKEFDMKNIWFLTSDYFTFTFPWPTPPQHGKEEKCKKMHVGRSTY